MTLATKMYKRTWIRLKPSSSKSHWTWTRRLGMQIRSTPYHGMNQCHRSLTWTKRKPSSKSRSHPTSIMSLRLNQSWEERHRLAHQRVSPSMEHLSMHHLKKVLLKWENLKWEHPKQAAFKHKAWRQLATFWLGSEADQMTPWWMSHIPCSMKLSWLGIDRVLQTICKYFRRWTRQ